ncbi:MAG: recombination regulator RecX [Endomicrobia bacterium]|nr:recombination regulator RecX [Endomicrobiia bacterium]MCL2798845.1 recombination regulator RecX [Endomicrobiia bacterium]
MKIIKLEKIPAKKDSFKVFFDNGENILLSADIIVKFGLNQGVEISDITFKEVLAADKAYRVIFDALTLVSKRSYSIKTLSDRLLLKGYEPDNIKSAVSRLTELGYINDEKYALAYAKYLYEKKGKGEYAVRKELEEKGISKELANKALGSLKTEAEPYEQIIETIKRKFKDFNAKDKNEVRRIASFFLRKGFASEDISKALRNYKSIEIE